MFPHYYPVFIYPLIIPSFYLVITLVNTCYLPKYCFFTIKPLPHYYRVIAEP